MTKNKVIPIKFSRSGIDQDEDIFLPRYMTQNCAGMDIFAAIDCDLVLKPSKVELIPTGFSIELPIGFEAQIRPRSGLAVNNYITVINSPGTIDADYRGEVKIALINFGTVPFTISCGDRIAQMVIAKIYRADFDVVKKLSPSNRGNNGFGHTGL